MCSLGICYDLSVVCLFACFDSLPPINNLSVKQGRVFLCWTSTKLRWMCLTQGPQRSDAGEARTCGPSVSSQSLYHWATAPPICCSWCLSRDRDRWYVVKLRLINPSRAPHRGKKQGKCCNPLPHPSSVKVIWSMESSFVRWWVISFFVIATSVWNISKCARSTLFPASIKYRATIGPPAKRHSDGVSLVGR